MTVIKANKLQQSLQEPQPLCLCVCIVTRAKSIRTVSTYSLIQAPPGQSDAVVLLKTTHCNCLMGNLNITQLNSTNPNCHEQETKEAGHWEVFSASARKASLLAPEHEPKSVGEKIFALFCSVYSCFDQDNSTRMNRLCPSRGGSTREDGCWVFTIPVSPQQHPIRGLSLGRDGGCPWPGSGLGPGPGSS